MAHFQKRIKEMYDKVANFHVYYHSHGTWPLTNKESECAEDIEGIKVRSKEWWIKHFVLKV